MGLAVEFGGREEGGIFQEIDSDSELIAIHGRGFQTHHSARGLDMGGAVQVEIRQGGRDVERHNLAGQQGHGRVREEKQAAQTKIFQSAVTLKMFPGLRNISMVLDIQRHLHPAEATPLRSKFHRPYLSIAELFVTKRLSPMQSLFQTRVF